MIVSKTPSSLFRDISHKGGTDCLQALACRHLPACGLPACGHYLSLPALPAGICFRLRRFSPLFFYPIRNCLPADNFAQGLAFPPCKLPACGRFRTRGGTSPPCAACENRLGSRHTLCYNNMEDKWDLHTISVETEHARLRKVTQKPPTLNRSASPTRFRIMLEFHFTVLFDAS